MTLCLFLALHSSCLLKLWGFLVKDCAGSRRSSQTDNYVRESMVLLRHSMPYVRHTQRNSKLGPIQFLIVIDDLPPSMTNNSSIFADDTMAYTACAEINLSSASLSGDLDRWALSLFAATIQGLYNWRPAALQQLYMTADSSWSGDACVAITEYR